jgi:hypothetical protein
LTTSGTSTAVTGLSNGTTYAFTVKAVNARGASGTSVPNFATPSTVPAPPTALTVGSTGNHFVSLSWSPPSGDGGTPILGYEVVVSPPCALCLGHLSLDTTTTIVGLSNGTNYSFSVRAINLRGPSVDSNIAGATAATTPEFPTGLTVTSTGNASVDLAWLAPASNGGSPVTAYEISTVPSCGGCTGLNPTGTSTTVGGLTNGTSYAFVVRAVNAKGNGPWAVPAVGIPAATPDPPTGLVVDSIGDGQVALDWAAPADDGGSPVTSYTVDVSPACSGCTGTTAVTSSSTVSGLTNGIVYAFEVRANNAKGSSSGSGSVNATPLSAPTSPSALVVTGTADESVSLSWTPPVDTQGLPVDRYEITVTPACGGCTGVVVPSGTSTTVDGLTNGTQYTFTVHAETSNGAGPLSLGVKATPSTTADAPTGLTTDSTGDRSVSLSWAAPADDGGSSVTGYEVVVSPACASCTGKLTTGTSTTVSNLTNGTSYTFGVRAITAKGAGASSSTVTETPSRAPGSPGTPVVDAVGDGSVDLSWSSPADTGGASVSGYVVITTPACGGCSGLNPAGTSTTVAGLQNGVNYTIAIIPVNAIGQGISSSVISAVPRTTPDAPTGLVVDAVGNGYATVSWAPPADNGGSIILDYEVTVSPTCSGCVGRTTALNTATVSGLTNGTTYTFGVKARNVAGAGPSATTVNVTPATVPDPPTTVTVAGTGDESVDLSWTAPVDNGGATVTSYVVTVLPACGGCTGSNPTGTSTTIVGLTNGVTYTFAVAAVNSKGVGSPAAPATAVPSTTPDAPTALTVTSEGNEEVHLSWAPPADDGGETVSSYDVQVSPSCGACTGLTSTGGSTVVTGLTNGQAYTFSVFASNVNGAGALSTTSGGTPRTVPSDVTDAAISAWASQQVSLTWSAPASNGSAVTGYAVEVSPPCPSCTGVSTAGTSTTVAGLTNGVNYSFTVHAVNAAGSSLGGNVLNAAPATIPTDPGGLSVMAVTDGEVHLDWDEPTDNGGSAITGYEVETVPPCVSCTGLITATSSTRVAGLSNGVQYAFKVRAKNAAGDGALTAASVNAMPVESPSEPQNLSSTPGDGSVSLSWGAPLDAGSTPITSYEVTVSPPCPLCTGLTTTNTGTDITGLTNGVPYVMSVRAVNSDGIGPAVNSGVIVTFRQAAEPTNVTAVPVGAGKITLSWTAPVDTGGVPLTGYHVDVSPTCASCTGLDPVGTSTLIQGLDPNVVNYSFWVRAKNAAGTSGGSEEMRASPFVRPSAPRDFKVDDVSPTSTSLSWIVPNTLGDPALQKYVNDVQPACAACTGLTTTGSSAVVEGLSPGVAYSFAVRAVSASGEGDLSPRVSASTSMPSSDGPSGEPVTTPQPSADGYWEVASDGGVFAYGAAQFYGSTGAIKLNQPIVGMASTPTGNGHWLVASDGGIFAYGDAQFFGSTGSIKLNKPIVGMASTPSGNGYWLVASDGGIFAYGDAQFFGSTGSIKLVQPIVGMAPTPSGGGYRLVASDGGIFAYGDAGFFGSIGGSKLNSPVVGMGSTPSGSGYWLVASDGGIFAYGDAGFHGSAGGLKLTRPIVGMTSTASGNGYWLVASDGGIFAYGDAVFHGSAGGLPLVRPVVGMATS